MVILGLVGDSQNSMADPQQLLMQVPAVIFTTDSDGACTFLNPHWTALTGMTIEESLGQGWLQAVHPEDRERVATAWHAAGARGDSYAIEYRLRPVNGDEDRWVHASGLPVSDFWVGTLVDVSVTRLQRRQLHETQELLSSVVGNLPILVWAIDRDEVLTLSEGRGLAELGFVSGARVGEPLEGAAGVDAVVLEYHRRALEGQAVTYELEFFGATLDCQLLPLHDAEGRPNGAVGLAVDVSERVAGERAREELEAELARARRLESVGRLAGGIAHDFNNLLSVIQGYVQFVIDRVSSEEVRADAIQVREAAERATILVQQLLAFSRLEEPAPELLDLEALLAALQPELEEIMGPEVEVILSAAPDLDPVLADRGQVEQAVVRVVANARDALQGAGKLRIAAGNRGPSEVEVVIEDEGLGMTEEVLALAFDPYFTTKERPQHLGLGLSTVYGMVEEAGGRVEVESAAGQGTTVRLLLPAATQSP